VPQARSSGSGSSSGGSSSGRSSSRRSSASRSSGSRSTGARQTTRSSSSSSGTKSRSRSSASTGGASGSSSARAAETATTADPRLEAVAQRVRKLNERIIDESKTAGEATLTAYEKALKAIASSLERGPGKSDVEWVSALATTQAKWIRDVTNAWTSAARGMLK
jgi:hypothetical protein